MNKTDFLNKLSIELSYSLDKCKTINDILENNFFISKKNKDKIVEELKEKLEINYNEAINIYETSVKIINDEIKYKMFHPLKSKD